MNSVEATDKASLGCLYPLSDEIKPNVKHHSSNNSTDKLPAYQEYGKHQIPVYSIWRSITISLCLQSSYHNFFSTCRRSESTDSAVSAAWWCGPPSRREPRSVEVTGHVAGVTLTGLGRCQTAATILSDSLVCSSGSIWCYSLVCSDEILSQFIYRCRLFGWRVFSSVI